MKSIVLMLILAFGVAIPATPAVKKTAKATKPTAAGKKGSKKRAAKTRARYTGQTTPSPERYREIQQALIDQGFLEGEATGQWDARSVEALKRLEASRDLRTDGRIDARTLQALGLGPKRNVPAEGVQQP